jgi:subtilase family serine protease
MTNHSTLLAAAAAVGLAVVCGGCGQSAPARATTGRATTASAGTTARLPALSFDCLTQAPPTCYTPRAFDTAYGIQPLLDRGIDGRGVTVVLPEVAQTGPAQPATVGDTADDDIFQDLTDFDSRFGLPSARLQVITTLAGPSALSWLANQEEVQDTELVDAVAPDATIVELLINQADLGSPAKLAALFPAMVRIAVRHGADVISFNGGGGEHLFTGAEAAAINSALEYAAERHVTFDAGVGDTGPVSSTRSTVAGPSTQAVKEISLPAADPLVLTVGGTSLTANHATGAYISETAWNLPPVPGGKSDHSEASGGGFSHLFARPAYQDGVPGIGAMRGTPDVAGDASTYTGMALVFNAPGGTYGLSAAYGDSASTPFWAGLIALADQQAGHPLGFVNPAIYQIARGPLYHQAFHDVTIGNNTVVLNGATITGYQAGPGWDPVTGWGTPNAQVLIPLLAR